MGNEDDGLTSSVKLFQEFEDGFAGFSVEVPRRFVSQQNLWFIHERSSDRHPLLLATAELVRSVK